MPGTSRNAEASAHRSACALSPSNPPKDLATSLLSTSARGDSFSATFLSVRDEASPTARVGSGRRDRRETADATFETYPLSRPAARDLARSGSPADPGSTETESGTADTKSGTTPWSATSEVRGSGTPPDPPSRPGAPPFRPPSDDRVDSPDSRGPPPGPVTPAGRPRDALPRFADTDRGDDADPPDPRSEFPAPPDAGRPPPEEAPRPEEAPPP